MKTKTKEKEVVKFEALFDGFNGGIAKSLNAVPTQEGYLTKRSGYTTFGQMVHELWKINKINKKMNFKGEYTVTLPLKGIKPIYKKTYEITN